MSNPLADEARTLNDEDLAEAINEAYRAMFNLQFQRGTRQLQNPMALKTARRQIARLRTILRERQHAALAGAPLEPLTAAPVSTHRTSTETAEPAEGDAAAQSDQAGEDQDTNEPAAVNKPEAGTTAPGSGRANEDD